MLVPHRFANSARADSLPSSLRYVLSSMHEDYHHRVIDANTKQGISPFGVSCLNQDMDIQDVRRNRLRQWIKNYYADNVSAFCRAVKKQQSQIADTLAGRKPFGEKIARNLESLAQMKEGWLDIEDQSNPLSYDALREQHADPYTSENSPEAQALIDRIRYMDLMKSIPKGALKSIDSLLSSLEDGAKSTKPEGYTGKLDPNAADKYRAKIAPTPKKDDDTTGQN